MKQQTIKPDILNLLYQALPLGEAMPTLLVRTEPPQDRRARFSEIVSLAEEPTVQCGIWAFGDFLTPAHQLAQSLPSRLGSFWHGIIHRREGDYTNSRYWFNRAGLIDLAAVPTGIMLLDKVVSNRRGASENLLQAQRNEWMALMRLCLDGDEARS